MATNHLGLAFEIVADPANAINAIHQFQQQTADSLNKVNESMKKSESVSKEFTNFLKAHLIFDVDEFIRLGRDAIDAMKSAAELGEQVANLSEATGMTAEQVSGLEFAMKQTGVQADTLDRATRELARNLSPLASSGSEGGKALKALGISATDATGHMKPLHELLLQIADAFHKTKDSTEKSADAAAIFGTRVGSEMIPFLDRGRGGILAMEGAARQLGVTLTDKDAKSLREMNEQLKLNDARLAGVKLRISEEIMPEFLRLANMLTGDSVTWKIWALNIEAALFTVVEIVDRAGSLLPGAWGRFNAAGADSAKRKVVELETETLLLQQKQDNLLKVFEGGAKGGGALSIPFEKGAKAAKTYSDALAHLVQTEKMQLQSFSDSLDPAIRQIDLAYQRQVDGAKKAIEAGRQLLARHKITLSQEEREEQEYTAFLTTAIQLRDAKLNEEFDKETARADALAKRTKEGEDALTLRGAGQEKRTVNEKDAALEREAVARGKLAWRSLDLESKTVQRQIAARNRAALESYRQFGEGVRQSFDSINQSLEMMGARHLRVYGEIGSILQRSISTEQRSAIASGAAAMSKTNFAIGALKQLAPVQAAVQVAKALGDLGDFNFWGAAQHFASAAMWGVVGASQVMSLVGSAGGGGRGGAGSSYRGSGGAASGSSSGERGAGFGVSALGTGAASAAHPPSGHLTVAIMGDNNAGEWLANTLNTAVEQRGVQLTSTRSTRSAYAQG